MSLWLAAFAGMCVGAASGAAGLLVGAHWLQDRVNEAKPSQGPPDGDPRPVGVVYDQPRWRRG